MSRQDTENGRRIAGSSSPGSLPTPQTQPSQPSMPAAPDTTTIVQGDVVTANDTCDGMIMEVTPDAFAAEDTRVQARRLLREFLSAVPRAEAGTSITYVRPDGVLRTLSRGQLSAAIDRLRFRQRQSVRWCVEERWPQERVSAALQGVSIRTIQRDLTEALDLLAEL